MADGKNDMEIPAVQRLPFAALQPHLGFNSAALRAASMFALRCLQELWDSLS